MGRPVVDLIGKRFGMLKVIKLHDEDFVGATGRKCKQWVCKCDCGNEIVVVGDHLKDKKHGKTSCGCANKQESIIGKRFGKLIVLKEWRDEKKKYKCKCKCDCGNEFIIGRYNLVNGKTTECSNCRDKRRPNRIRDLTGMKFGRLTVLKMDEETHVSKGGAVKYKWICQCECGRTISVTTNALQQNKTKSCGCLSAEKMNMTIEEYDKKVRTKLNESTGLFKDLTGQRFGNLIALEPIRDRWSSGRSVVKWLCQCDCGNTHIVSRANLVSGHTQSCGCIDSAGEAAIGRILKKNKIQCKKEITFPDCRDSHPLPFDFGILSDDNSLVGIIEYDGLQHFKVVRFNGMTQERAEESFRTGILHDQMKDQYCKDHNIPLLRIKYTEFDNIENLIMDFSKRIGDTHDRAISSDG